MGIRNGQGGIRTHDTLAGIPVFEAHIAKVRFFVPSGIASNPIQLLLFCESKTDQRFRSPLTQG